MIPTDHDIATLRKAGLSARQIAAKLKISRTTVQRRLHQAVGAGLLPAEALLPGLHRPDITAHAVAALWLQRWTRKEIAAHFSAARDTIDNRLAEAREMELIPDRIAKS